jgi:hypothetical protein
MDRRWCVMLTLVVLATACGSESISAEREPTQPPGLGSRLQGSMEVSPERVRPGEQVAVRLPDHKVFGIAFSLGDWQQAGWQTRYYLSSDGGDLNWTPSWWSVEDSERRGWPDIGVGGPEPHHLVIPDSAPADTYRLCTANTLKKACAMITVTP